MCLVNNAVYIVRYRNEDDSLGNWTATGTQFAVPYFFKKCFSEKPVEFKDLCETKEVTNSVMYLDMNEDIMNDNYPLYQKLKDVRIKKFNGKSLTKSELKILSDYENMSDEELDSKLGSYHKFVGRVGLFTPILPGKGGGQLIRESVDKNGNVKYDSVVGTKGYMWLESEDVVKNNKQDEIL